MHYKYEDIKIVKRLYDMLVSYKQNEVSNALLKENKLCFKSYLGEPLIILLFLFSGWYP